MKKNTTKLFPFLLAVLITLYGIINLLTKEPGFTSNGEAIRVLIPTNLIFAALGLLLTGTLIVFKKNIWKWVFLLITILGQTPFVKFHFISMSFGVGSIGIDLLSACLTLFFLIFNSDIFPKKIFTIEADEEKEKTKDEKAKLNWERQTNFWIEKFKNKSSQELRIIATSNDRVPEAIEAAKRILEME